MILLAFSIHANAVIAQPIASHSRLAFPSWYIASRRARTVVVVNAVFWILLDLVDRIKFWHFWHSEPPFTGNHFTTNVIKYVGAVVSGGVRWIKRGGAHG